MTNKDKIEDIEMFSITVTGLVTFANMTKPKRYDAKAEKWVDDENGQITFTLAFDPTYGKKIDDYIISKGYSKSTLFEQQDKTLTLSARKSAEWVDSIKIDDVIDWWGDNNQEGEFTLASIKKGSIVRAIITVRPNDKHKDLPVFAINSILECDNTNVTTMSNMAF